MYRQTYGTFVPVWQIYDFFYDCFTGPKLLHEVDLNTRDEIGLRLESRRGCLGGWRQVAAKFDMQDNRIAALDNSKEPGKDVLEFLMGTKPNLTVYSFCKVLKEDILSRFDIAKLLEDHLLIRKDSSSWGENLSIISNSKQFVKAH